MRYTTPEWLLENLEERLRIALEQRNLPRERGQAAKADTSESLLLQTQTSSPMQPTA